MSGDEKWRWWACLSAIFGVPSFFNALILFSGTDKGRFEAPPILATITLAFLIMFLLVLSWRAAYLAGKKKR